MVLLLPDNNYMLSSNSAPPKGYYSCYQTADYQRNVSHYGRWLLSNGKYAPIVNHQPDGSCGEHYDRNEDGSRHSSDGCT